MARGLAVALVSGGMDSCVAAAEALQNRDLAFLHASYGQRTEARELRAFHDVADFYGIANRLVVPMEHLARIGGSSLTDRRVAVEDADLRRKGIPASYVPFRNANLLAVAVSWAEVLGAEAVVIGAVEEDSSGYPDCRSEFFRAFDAVIAEGTRPGLRICIETPVIAKTKAQIVMRGTALGAPLHLTWSCYRDDHVACGTCDSCALRLRGFRGAGIEDPIPYRVRPDYSSS